MLSKPAAELLRARAVYEAGDEATDGRSDGSRRSNAGSRSRSGWRPVARCLVSMEPRRAGGDARVLREGGAVRRHRRTSTELGIGERRAATHPRLSEDHMVGSDAQGVLARSFIHFFPM